MVVVVVIGVVQLSKCMRYIYPHSSLFARLENNSNKKGSRQYKKLQVNKEKQNKKRRKANRNASCGGNEWTIKKIEKIQIQS